MFGDYSHPVVSFVRQHKVPFLYSPTTNTPPLKESILQTLALVVCPTLRLISLTNFIALALIVMYSIAITQGIDTSVSILQVNVTTMLNFGANCAVNLYQGQVYRLLTAGFLCPSLPNLLNNLLILYLLLPRFEACVKPVALVSITLISLVAGNILQDLASNSIYRVASGPSTFLYGYIGLATAYLIVNWSALSMISMLREQLCCTIAIINMFALIFAFYVSPGGIDYYGHLGGYIGGLFGSMVLINPLNNDNSYTFRIVGGSVLFVYFLVDFLVFYLAKF